RRHRPRRVVALRARAAGRSNRRTIRGSRHASSPSPFGRAIAPATCPGSGHYRVSRSLARELPSRDHAGWALARAVLRQPGVSVTKRLTLAGAANSAYVAAISEGWGRGRPNRWRRWLVASANEGRALPSLFC